MAVGSNRDDRIMAMALAVYLCPQADWSHSPIQKQQRSENTNTRAYMKFLELQATEAKENLHQAPLNLL